MQTPFKVAIVGAGICGLTTAIACQNAGAEVTVFEAAPKLLPLGTAISLWPNALTCLDKIGLGPQIAALGHPFDRIVTRHPDGTPIMRFDLADLHAKHGQTSRCVTRAALHTALLTEVTADHVKLGAAVENVSWTQDDATMTMADGTMHSADLVVVADGLNSRLRAQVAGPDTLRPAGYGAVLGLAPMWRTPPGWGAGAEACEYYGPNGRFGVIRSDINQTYWFFVSKAVPPATRAVPVDPAWLMDQLRDWPAFARELVVATPQDQMPQVALNDRAPAKHWGNGRVLLAGDTAHPMLPNFGQGANQAIEDAYAIGLGLERGKAGLDLAQFYSDMRKRKADGIVKQNRQNGQMTQQEGRFGQLIRNAVMRMMPQRVVTAQLDRHFTVSPPT